MSDSRMPLLAAEALADQVVVLLRHACERIEIAGSIRRRRELVKDVEIVAVPRLVPSHDLFGQQTGTTDGLERTCEDLVARGILSRRTDAPAWGPKHKRLTFEGINVDLFAVVPPAQWGVILTIRTGPGEFSKALVTRRKFGGLLPDKYIVRDGAIRNRASETVVPTPEEADVFRVLGVDPIEPWERRWPLGARR